MTTAPAPQSKVHDRLTQRLQALGALTTGTIDENISFVVPVSAIRWNNAWFILNFLRGGYLELVGWPDDARIFYHLSFGKRLYLGVPVLVGMLAMVGYGRTGSPFAFIAIPLASAVMILFNIALTRGRFEDLVIECAGPGIVVTTSPRRPFDLFRGPYR